MSDTARRRFLASGAFIAAAGLTSAKAFAFSLDSGNAARINELALQAVAVFAVMGVAMALRYYLFMTVGERVVTRLRARLFKTLMDQEIGFFDGQKTGDLISRLASDTAVLQTSVSANISMGLRSLTVAAGTLVTLGLQPRVVAG